MRSYTVVDPDGKEIEVRAPDGTPQATLIQMAQRQTATARKPSFEQSLLSSAPGRVLKGIKDPIDAGAQMIPRGLSALTSLGGLFPNRVSEFMDAEAKSVDRGIEDSEREYQTARWAGGQEGFDGGRMTGNIISPANLALARLAPVTAAGSLGRALQGGKAGLLGGLFNPVTDTSGASFGAQKTGQAAVGAAGGAVFAPLVGKAVDLLAPTIKSMQARFTDPKVLATQTILATDDAIEKVMRDAGVEQRNVPPDVMQELRRQVAASFKSGQRLDASAALRKMDFDAQGVPALRGQITRDPAQYSRDMNMRGIEGVGEPIQNVLTAQNQKITQGLTKYGGTKAAEKYPAGESFVRPLKALDDRLSGDVRRAYQNARASSGKDWDVPLTGLADDVQRVIDDFGIGGEKNAVPSAIVARMKTFGIVGDGMTQRKVFNYEEADRLLKQINAHDDGMNGSIGALRAAVKRSILEGGGEGDPFAPARKLAASRFSLIDAVPALEAVAKAKNPQEVSRLADDFVQQHIIGARVVDLKKLAEVLPDQQMAEAKKQIARVIYEGAFRNNATGDKMVSPAGLQQAMKKIGTDKLQVFFNPKEIEELQRLTRVAAYANTEPAWGTVARGGNPGGVLLGGAAKLAGAGGHMASALPLIGAAQNSLRASSAVNTQVPRAPNLSPEELAAIQRFLSRGSVATGNLLAP